MKNNRSCPFVSSGTYGLIFLRLQQCVAFMLACLFTAALMRLLVREYDVLFSLPVGCLSLVLAFTCAWSSLRRCRFGAPVRSAAVLGLCAGIGGAGLFIVVVHAIGYLLPSYIGPVPSL